MEGGVRFTYPIGQARSTTICPAIMAASADGRHVIRLSRRFTKIERRQGAGRRSDNCCIPGARRAGQGRLGGERSERSLDALEHSRMMLRRSDDNLALSQHNALPSRVLALINSMTVTLLARA